MELKLFRLFFSGRSKHRHSSSHAAGSTNQDPSVTFRNHLSSSSISLSSSHPSSPRDPPSNKNRHSFGSTPPVTTQSHSITPGRRSLPAHSSIPASFRNTEILPNKQRHSSGNSNSSTGSGHRASSRGTQNEESSRNSISMKGWNTIQVRLNCNNDVMSCINRIMKSSCFVRLQYVFSC